MPTTVKALFDTSNLSIAGSVPWGTPVPATQSGIYVVSLSSTTEDVETSIMTQAPIDTEKVAAWIQAVPLLKLDGVRPTTSALVRRLTTFWMPDEVILYIGQTTSQLRKRVRQYYRTPLGAPGPHAGGHWIKTLTEDALSSLYVYYAPTAYADSNAFETMLLRNFICNVSDTTKLNSYDSHHPYPFANLELTSAGSKIRKQHGISNPVNRI